MSKSMRTGNNIKGFLRSFGFAAQGLISCVNSERNMRFHIGAAVFVIWIMRFYCLSAAKSAVLYLCIGAVIALELINTAIESVVDLVSPDKNNKAKKAKDCAAGAVLVMAFISVICAVYILWDTAVFAHIWEVMTDKPYRICILAALTAIWLVWVFFPRKSEEVENEQKQ
ncbi:MAG: diacylglycerol kinase family protein [Ruminococcus sp.]|nr:diacylglycerol kinase family protein [Ruminococcus sp.]